MCEDYRLLDDKITKSFAKVRIFFLIRNKNQRTLQFFQLFLVLLYLKSE